MTKQDLLQRFIFDNAPIRGEFIYLQESFQTIVNQHDYPPAIQKLLGEALCVAGLLSAIIKFDGRLSVQFRGKGRLKFLLAQCDNNFHLRGLAKWDGDLTYDDLMEAFNEGILAIMLDSGVKQSRYQGIVAWRGNSLVESIQGYFKDSEQLATKIWLDVNETSAVGFLLQVAPTSERDATGIEKEIITPNWEHITRLSSQLNPQDLHDIDYQTLLLNLYPDDEIRIFPSAAVKFQCNCTRKRGENAIEILGQEEAEAEIKDKNSIVVTCDFCNKEYIYSRSDVDKIFSHKNSPPSDTQLH